MKRYLTIIWLTVILATVIRPWPVDSWAQSGRTPAKARNGMVVTSHYLASQVGTEVLRKGGNAIDAAVATAFALAVSLPGAGNIGGGGFIVYHGADGEVTAFDFREKAPLSASLHMYLDAEGEVVEKWNEGILGVGVPGTVAGLWLAHQRLGSVPWKDLVDPAIEMARKGIPWSWGYEWYQDFLLERDDAVFAASRKYFLKNGNESYQSGDLWKQADLAKTLKKIRDKGPDGFYRGETARLIAGFMRRHGGLITEEDLATYQAFERKPVHGTYRGYDVYSMPPPSSGGTVLVEMLNVLEAYDLADIGHNSAQYMHLLTEAMRRAYADRALHLADPDFNPDIPVERLTSKEYASELRRSIDPFQASESDSARFNGHFLDPTGSNTTHLSVVDPFGNAVSMTYTLEYWYGSRIAVDGAGFLLNNEMGDFNPQPGVTNRRGRIGTGPNLIAPGKRMLSSMTPTIVARDGRPHLVVGSPGGRTIINTVLQVILNVVDHGMNIGQAIEAPRFHHGWLPDTTRIEKFGFSADTRRLYEMMGHPVSVRRSQGVANGILIDHAEGLLFGAADSRTYDARAVGY